MNILSIQSHVAYGHVGNASAAFCMQRLGVEVWPIHTVQFSNHTGYGDWKGRVFDGGMIDEVMEGIAERGVLPSCDGVLSGYMGSADIGHAILSAVERVRAANPKAMYCCDPVIGDVGRGIFVRPGIPEFIREQAVPAADIVTPNQFELELLTDVEVRNIGDAHRAVEALRDAGPKVVLVTSLITDETPDDAIAALFLVHVLDTGSCRVALERAASSIWGLLSRTKAAGSREILTVAAQDEFVRPDRMFEAEAF